MNPLEKLAELQLRYTAIIVLLILIFTGVALAGVGKIEFQGDIDKEMPQDMAVFRLQDTITDQFGGDDTFVILVSLDQRSDVERRPVDIRSGEVMEYVRELSDDLLSETSINDVVSVASYLPFGATDEQIRQMVGGTDQLQTFFNKDYSATLMYVQATVGKDSDKIKQFIQIIEDDIDAVPKPPGVDTEISGTPYIIDVIITLLQQDAMFTILIASIIIFVLLIILERSLTKALLVFIPLSLGLLWTMGTMGWFGMKLSVATVGIGPMILGLGVEYGVFVVSRYKEERQHKNRENALKTTVRGIGSAISGSATTTIVGFLALTLSVYPMLQHLGQSLAMGIFFVLLAALIANPVLLLLEENLEGFMKPRLRRLVK